MSNMKGQVDFPWHKSFIWNVGMAYLVPKGLQQALFVSSYVIVVKGSLPLTKAANSSTQWILNIKTVKISVEILSWYMH